MKQITGEARGLPEFDQHLLSSSERLTGLPRARNHTESSKPSNFKYIEHPLRISFITVLVNVTTQL